MQDGAASAGSQLATEADEASVVAALRAGDEDVFRDLVKRYHASLVRLAQASVASHAVAEEVVQDTRLAMIKGIRKFGGRSSLKTWIFRILVNQARKRGVREHRIIPMSSLGADGSCGDASPAVDADQFFPESQRWAGHWSAPPVPWVGLPLERMIGNETVALVARTRRSSRPRGATSL